MCINSQLLWPSVKRICIFDKIFYGLKHTDCLTFVIVVQCLFTFNGSRDQNNDNIIYRKFAREKVFVVFRK